MPEDSYVERLEEAVQEAKNMKMLAESFQKLMRTDRPEKQVGGDSWVRYVLGIRGCLKGRFCDITFRALLIMRYAEE